MRLIQFIFASSHTVIVHQIPIHILQEIKNYGNSIKIYDTRLLRARSKTNSHVDAPIHPAWLGYPSVK